MFNQKAHLESSVLQDCGDIKITYMSRDRIFISIELTPNGHMTLLVVQGVFSQEIHGSAGAPTRGWSQNLMLI